MDSSPGDTTGRTVVRGSAGAGGWRPLELGPGEPREEAPPAGTVIGCLWHLSDVHVCDSESPARLEYLDRHGDPDMPFREILGDIGTYRPQEALTVQVATTMVCTVNSMRTGPHSGAPIDCVVVTGDLTDNAQRNELSWYRTILEGGVISPRSGGEDSSWVGATRPGEWDERYWHPDGPPLGVEPDRPTRLFGFPTIPGLVEASRADVVSPGLDDCWLSVFGNHDGLLQGTVPANDELRGLAIGASRICGLPADASPLSVAEAIPGTGPARYLHDHSSPRLAIAADAERAIVEPSGLPNYFSADVGDLRLLALDTVNPHGGWQGSVDAEQMEWLASELELARDRYVVIASHHPSPTIVNDYAPGGAPARVLGTQIIDLLLRHRSVIAWIAGHVHFHAAGRHGDSESGFWEITTASLIDWPQQGRILEVLRVDDRGRPEIAIVSTVVDHAAPPSWSFDDSDPTNLAAISRALAANDYRLRDGAGRGSRLEGTGNVRNVTWRLPDPLA